MMVRKRSEIRMDQSGDEVQIKDRTDVQCKEWYGPGIVPVLCPVFSDLFHNQPKLDRENYEKLMREGSR